MELFRTLIVSAAIAPSVRGLSDTWPGGIGMFIVPLYTGGAITHYMSSGMLSGAIAERLPHTDYSGEGPAVIDGDLESLVEAINTDNPSANATVEGLTAMLSGADISTQDWRDAIARMNLTMEPAL